MNKKLKFTLKLISNALLVIVVLLSFLLYGLQLFGIKAYSVLSPSMQSAYPVGSLIYVKQVDTNSLKINDPITFYLEGKVVATHRIVELVPDEDNPNKILFRTKGDENEEPDKKLVAPEKIIGKPFFCIPFLGFLGTYISQPPGRYLAIVFVSVIILIEIMIGIILDGDKNKSKSVQN